MPARAANRHVHDDRSLLVASADLDLGRRVVDHLEFERLRLRPKRAVDVRRNRGEQHGGEHYGAHDSDDVRVKK